MYRLTFWSRHDPRVRRKVKGDDDQFCQNTTDSQAYSVGMQTQEELTTEEKPWWQRVLCGSRTPDDKGAAPVVDEEEQAKEAVKIIHEPPFWKDFLDVNAIICLALCTLVYGYFA
ncbi:sodium/myo-inositol cotransporter 2-like [Penaeus japonicus]|uniref:sodium/myo-inositol cotransporter 2-like n=1 Tax=Penaeus japonicus TaxID=27405 RepID=UPI001C7164BF|nr:sodium/myo-inositol cotransporter 2-like [Penaeus japonicus]